MEKRSDIVVGTKWFRFSHENKLIVVRVLGFVGDNKVSVIPVFNKLEEREDRNKRHPQKRKLSIDILLNDYTLLNPDSYMVFNAVSINKGDDHHLDDVIVSLHKYKDFINGNTTPYCVCRQNIINPYSTVIMPTSDTYSVGCCMSIDTIPDGVDYRMMTACDEIVKTVSIAVYIDDSLSDILKLVGEKNVYQFNNILTNLHNERIKYLSSKGDPDERLITFHYKDDSGKTCFIYTHDGYVFSLKDLLIVNGFEKDFRKCFEIYRTTYCISKCIIKGSIIDGFVISKDAVDAINEQHFDEAVPFEFYNPVFFLYDRDIRLSDLGNYFLIMDGDGLVYVCSYEEEA